MTVTQDLSFLSLINNASLLVQLVMALLLLVSIMSWTYIFRKMFAIRSARTQTETFERAFWSGGNLNALYEEASSNRGDGGALERIFEAGMGEFGKAKATFAGQAAVDPNGNNRRPRRPKPPPLPAAEGPPPCVREPARPLSHRPPGERLAREQGPGPGVYAPPRGCETGSPGPP